MCWEEHGRTSVGRIGVLGLSVAKHASFPQHGSKDFNTKAIIHGIFFWKAARKFLDFPEIF